MILPILTRNSWAGSSSDCYVTRIKELMRSALINALPCAMTNVNIAVHQHPILSGSFGTDEFTDIYIQLFQQVLNLLTISEMFAYSRGRALLLKIKLLTIYITCTCTRFERTRRFEIHDNT